MKNYEELKRTCTALKADATRYREALKEREKS